VTALGEHQSRTLLQAHDDVCREFAISEPSDPVGAEETTHVLGARLALRVLRSLTSLLETGLLALFHAGIPRKEA